MSCQKVLSMLSAYIDGEVQTSDAEMIKAHLSECDSCAAEWRALRSMTGMLRTTPEVEPPAFLLAQIEAATVNRTGFLTKLQRAFDQVPTMVRWASAPVAAAIVLLGILLSNSNDVQTPVAVKSPTERIEGAIPGMLGLPNVAIEEQAPSAGTVVAVRPVVKAVSKTRGTKASASTRKANGHHTTRPEVKGPHSGGTIAPEEPEIEEPIVDETQVAEDTTPKAETDVAANTGNTPEIVKVAGIPSDKPAKKNVIIDESGTMDQLRAKLAAKSKSKFNGQEDRIEGKKYSVELVSLRF